MGTYIGIEDITERMKQISFSATSHPSLSEVDGFIEVAEAEMTARLQAVGISTPVTDATKVLVLKGIAANRVIAEVLRAVELATEDAERYQKLYEDAMARIEKRPAIIEETSESHSAPEGSKRASTPFRRGERQW